MSTFHLFIAHSLILEKWHIGLKKFVGFAVWNSQISWYFVPFESIFLYHPKSQVIDIKLYFNLWPFSIAVSNLEDHVYTHTSTHPSSAILFCAKNEHMLICCLNALIFCAMLFSSRLFKLNFYLNFQTQTFQRKCSKSVNLTILFWLFQLFEITKIQYFWLL